MIREAIPSDLPALIHMGRRFHLASGYADFGIRYSEEKMGASFQAHMDSPDVLLLIAERDEQPIGLACAAFSTLYMSDDPVCIELYWWVNPEARGGSAAMKMKARLEEWGRERGAAAAAMSSLAEISDSPADAIFARTGYHHMEKSWIKRL